MFLPKYQSHTNTLYILNGMDMSLKPPCNSALKITYKERTIKSKFVYISMKTRKAFQIWTKMYGK